MPEYKRGYLSDFFEGFAFKRLTTVELGKQHEFQGVRKLREILGTPSEKVTFPTRFVWLDDDEGNETITSFVTWSDVRRAKAHRSPEYHLYYSPESEGIVHRATPGDLLLVCKPKDGTLLVVIASAGSTMERQLSWLFDFPLENDTNAHVQSLDDSAHGRELGFAARFILDELGIETAQTDENWLDILVQKFGTVFPTTATFSAFARENLKDVSARDNPDDVLMAWMDHEEMLFRTLENHIVGERLRDGFCDADGPDVDGFVSFSLSVHNRRKSRAGYALENHLEPLFAVRNLQYARGARTELKKKPDFLFPGAEEYHDPDFPADRLTLLGAKSTLKERWRQVPAEADRIETKHLLTLEPGISESQTTEMQESLLQLVVPSGLHSSYTDRQQEWLFCLGDFIELVERRQKT